MQPSAIIFSGKNLLARDLYDSLVSVGCKVTIHERNLSKLDADYVFVLWDFKGEISHLEEQSKRYGKRVIFIRPFAFSEKKTFLKTVIIGELYGPGMTDFTDVFPSILLDAVVKRRLEIPKIDFELEISYSPDTAADLTRIMLSYGLVEPVSVLSKKVKFFDLLKEVEKIIPDTLLIESQANRLAAEDHVFPRIRQRFEDPSAIKKTLDWIIANPQAKKVLATTPQDNKPKKHIEKGSFKFRIRHAIFGLSVVIALICLPFVLLLSSAGLLKVGFGAIKSGKVSFSQRSMQVANLAASASQKTFYFYSQTPILGKAFLPMEKISEIVVRASRIGLKTITLTTNLEDLAGNILGSKSYDIDSLSENTYLAIESLYKDSSFLQSEIDSLPAIARKYSAQVNDFEKMRTFLLHGQTLAKRMPILLGSQKPVVYLILFQNNMELRPTGGFIGSFGLATFDKGVLSDIEFFDVYTADGQLKGHIEPPLPIKNYLGEANWYLRDSNWDPDFQVSAARAEWFLEKEIDRPVDGVISIDLEVAKSILKEIGPLTLSDIGVTVDEKNLYEKVQYYVEANFFAGSQNKSNILTSLGKSILGNLSTIGSEKLVKIAEGSVANLEKRHIQFFPHDNESRNAISLLGWDGGVVPGSVGLVEANVGVNKANYFIQRKIDVVTELGNDNIKNTMTVTAKNTASIALGISGRYKSYMRVMAPSGSKDFTVEISGPSGIKKITPDVLEVNGRIEAGVLVEVLPSETKNIIFRWKTPSKLNFNKVGEYVFRIRKQAGTGDDPVTVRVVMPRGVDFLGNTYYNTILARDLVSRISWK